MKENKGKRKEYHNHKPQPFPDTKRKRKGQRLQVVDKFTYLGSILSRTVHIDDEVNARTAKASAAFGRYVEVFGIEEEFIWHASQWSGII